MRISGARIVGCSGSIIVNNSSNIGRLRKLHGVSALLRRQWLLAELAVVRQVLGW